MKNKDINITLINPWIIDFKAYDLWMKPLGLLYISSILKKNGYNVNLIDCMDRNHHSLRKNKLFKADMTGKFNEKEIPKPKEYKNIPRRYKRYGITIESFIEDIKSLPRPDIIMVTSIMTYWYAGPHLAISLLKETFPSTPIILGGIYGTLCSDFAKKNSGAHIIFEGSNIKKLLNMVEELTDTKAAFKPQNFIDFPAPDFSHYKNTPYVTIMTSAGCPYKCTYCASKKLQPDYIRKEPASVIKELNSLTHKTSHIAFYDDALLVNKDKYIIPILNSIIKNNKNLNFHIPNGIHARFIDKALAGLMKKAGFEVLNIGLESAIPHIQEKTGNKVMNNDIENAVEHLLYAGFSPENIRLYTLMGLPGQTFEEVDKTIEYIFDLKVQNRLSAWSPVPGSEDFKNFDGKKNPLYHNSTYHYYLGTRMTFEERKYLKDRADRLNKKTLRF